MAARILLTTTASYPFRRPATTTTTAAAAAVAILHISSTRTRSLSQSPRSLLKESASSDPNASDFAKHRDDSVEKQKRGQGHWKPELASVSEETVKADRMTPGEAGEAAMKRLQEQTKGHAEETAKHGTSMKDNM